MLLLENTVIVRREREREPVLAKELNGYSLCDTGIHYTDFRSSSHDK